MDNSGLVKIDVCEEYHKLLNKFNSLTVSYEQLKKDYEYNEKYREENADIERKAFETIIKKLKEEHKIKVEHVEQENKQIKNVLNLTCKLLDSFSNKHHEISIERLNVLLDLHDKADLVVLSNLAKIVDSKEIK